MKVGRAIAGAVLGFLFLLFVGADLVLFGVVPLNSVVVTILPAVGFVLGAVLGGLAGGRARAPQDQSQVPMPGQPFAPPAPM